MATTNTSAPQAKGQKKDLAFLHAKKRAGQKITMLTCYDYPTALLEDEAGIDIIFVGDSVGTNMLGYKSEREVTMDDMLHHVLAVRRGTQNAYLLADMPYCSYDTPEIALRNAQLLIVAGADRVKLEGGQEQVATVSALAEAGLDVCGHIGYTPQTLGQPGKKARIQGKTHEQAIALVQSALALQQAGLDLIVLELVPELLSRIITMNLRIPTIGIGGGRFCDGQVLIVNDLLGLSPFRFRFVKQYAQLHDLELDALQQYRREVEAGTFPGEENAFPIEEDELRAVEEWAAREL